MSDDWFQLETQRQVQEAMELADSHGHRLTSRDWSDLSLLRSIALTFLCAILIVVASNSLL